MLSEDRLSEVLPASMRKEVVSTRREVPISTGSSMSVIDSYYTPRVFRWAIDRWFEGLPADLNLEAVRGALPIALADAETFHGYLQVPEAFVETYEDKLREIEQREVDLARLKRALPRRAQRSWRLAGVSSAFLLGLAVNLSRFLN